MREKEVEILDNYDYEKDEILLNKTHKETNNINVLEHFMQKFMDLMIQNQKIVENLVRSNDSLREDIAVMIGKMERLYDKFDEFVTLVKEAAYEETEDHIAREIVKETISPLKEALEKMGNELKEANENIADLLTSIDKRLKKLSLSQTMASGGGMELGDLKERMMNLLNKGAPQQ